MNKRAAIYCRVSTEDQEREGSSLRTQLEASLQYCREQGYEVCYRFSEAYSGLTLERPKLNELRELVRKSEIDAIIVYCLDRLSRDPVDGVILTQELEKHGVRLEAVTEDIDNSELGKLISYIRGFASKLEAEKIRERTIRGKKEMAKQGRIPGGGSSKIYGYSYRPVSQENGGRRVENETESKWVKQIFEWLAYEGISTNQILYRLRANGAPTKSGKPWNRHSVLAILKNPAYCGKTFVFTTAKGKKQYTRPREEWIEIAGVTPPIITQELFEAAQKQLQVNREKASRNNTRRQYLLRGHIRCRRCGRAYVGGVTLTVRKDKRYTQRRYTCIGKSKVYNPVKRCNNKGWSSDKLEALVWPEIERVLNNPEIIISEIRKQRNEADQLGVLESQLKEVEHNLKIVDREQAQLLQWALKGFPEETVMTENKRYNENRKTLLAQKKDLEEKIDLSQNAAMSVPKLENVVQLAREKISNLDFDAKRMAIDMLDIKIWLDGDNIEVNGILPVTDDVNVSMQSLRC